MKVLVDHKHQWLSWVFSLWMMVVILAVACGELPQSVVREQAPTHDVQLEEVQPEQKKAVPLSREQILIREAYKLLGAPADVVYGPYSKSIPQELKMPAVHREQAEADSVNKKKPEKKKKKSKNDSNKNKKKVKKDTQDQKSAQKVVKKQEIDYKEDNIENFGSCIVGDKPTLATIDNKLLSDLGDDVHLNLEAIKKSDIKLDGGSGSLHYEMVTSKNSLRDALNLGVGGGGSSLFGLVDVKASMEYHKKSVISEESLYYVAHLEVNNPDIVMTNVKLSPKAHELYKKRGAEAFFKRCGRKAVIGFRSGGTLSAVAKYTSSDSENLEEGELVAAANAHIPGLMGVDVSGNVGLSKGKKFSGIKVSFFTAYSGGRPEEIPTTVEDLPKIAEKWGASVRKHGVIKGLITKSYKELIANINIDPDYDVIQDNIILYIEALDRLSNMRDVMLKTSKYNIVKKSLLRKTVNKQLDKLIIRLHEKLEKCRLSRKAAVCVDEELLREVDDFKPTVMVKHSSCGFEKTRITDRNPICGKEKYETDQWLESHPDCEVKQYTPIVVDSIQVSRITEKIRGFSYDNGADPYAAKYYDKARNYKFSVSDYPEACRGPDVERKQEFDNGLSRLK